MSTVIPILAPLEDTMLCHPVGDMAQHLSQCELPEYWHSSTPGFLVHDVVFAAV